MKSHPYILLFCLSLAPVAAHAQGGEFEWTGGGSGANWNTDNWGGGAPYANADQVGNLRSGHVAMAANGTVFLGRLDVHVGATLRFDGSPTATNLHMNGGTLHSWNAVGSLEGRIHVDAASFLTGANPGIKAKILGGGDLSKIGTSSWIGCNWNASEWTGRLIVSGGAFKVYGSAADLGTHEVIVSPDCVWGLWVPPSGGWKIRNSLLGSGRISTIRADALTLRGSTIKPGDAAGGIGVGKLTIRNDENYNLSLIFDTNGVVKCRLVVDVTGEGGVAGTDYDQLLIDHSVDRTQSVALGTGKADLVVCLQGRLNLAGQTLTILKVANGALSGSFANVTLTPADWRATVNYTGDSVTLSNIYRLTRGTVVTFR